VADDRTPLTIFEALTMTTYTTTPFARVRSASLVLGVVLAACPSDDPSAADSTSGDATGPDTDTDTTNTDATDTDATDTSGVDCGNDIIEEGEECDGVDLGGSACADVDPGFVGGTLACGATCTFDASGCTIDPGAAVVAINELTSEAVLAGDFMGPNDAIELHNAGGIAADVSGWQISDDAMFLPEKTYVFPAGTMIEPGAFVVLLSVDLLSGTGDFPFGISDSVEETITLVDADGVMVDAIATNGYEARVSYCRLPDASGPWFQCEQTFGAANQLAATACGNGMIEDVEECDGDDVGGVTCEALALGYTGGAIACTGACNLDADGCTTDSAIVLNEIDATNDNIEIFNGSAGAIDLSGWVLTDDNVEADYDATVDTAELVFGPGTTLAAGAYLVVGVGFGPGQHPFGLGLGGDSITLLDPAGGVTIIDQVTYGAAEATVSYCRQPNGPGGVWTADCAATMGGAN